MGSLFRDSNQKSRGKESLNESEKGPKKHFEEFKILAKCVSTYLVIKIYY